MKSTIVCDTFSYIRDNTAHMVNGACHLLPSHVRKIREYAASSNDIVWYEIFVMLLMSIELFLQKMEYSSLDGDNFNTNMFVMSDEFVPEALNLKVKGKKKRKKKRKGLNDFYACWRTLYIWGDDTYPDIDLKRNLLGYLYCIGWKGGTLFPTKKELENPPLNGVYTTSLSEDELFHSLKYLYKTVLKRDDKLTSHSGRKSGYLWNRIRGADAAQLMTAADHEVYEVACRYAKDCDAVTSVQRIFQDPNQQLGNFRSCYCAGDETAVDSAAPGKQWQVPLSELVVGFIEQRVGVSVTDPKRRHPNFIMTRILSWRKPTNPIDELKGHLKDISQDKSTAIINCVYTLQGEAIVKARIETEKRVEEMAQERLKTLVGQFIGHFSNQSGTDSGSVSDELNKFLLHSAQLSKESESPPLITPEKPKFKKSESRRGCNELKPRDNFWRWTAEEKLSYIRENFDSDTGKYQNKDRIFLLKVSKLYKCLVTCCQGRTQVFVQKHANKGGNFALSTWKPCEECA